jgi:hypothetical protein
LQTAPDFDAGRSPDVGHRAEGAAVGERVVDRSVQIVERNEGSDRDVVRPWREFVPEQNTSANWIAPIGEFVRNQNRIRCRQRFGRNLISVDLDDLKSNKDPVGKYRYHDPGTGTWRAEPMMFNAKTVRAAVRSVAHVLVALSSRSQAGYHELGKRLIV